MIQGDGNVFFRYKQNALGDLHITLISTAMYQYIVKCRPGDKNNKKKKIN